jgi:hypothetical protein
MSAEVKKEIQLEIAHVLFIDAVGYSKLSLNDQRKLIDRLNQLVRSTAEFRSAEAAGKLIKIATGDGMALVFYNRLEAPVECALQISRALKEYPELRLRMGVHSGPVSGVIDVNELPNIAGAGGHDEDAIAHVDRFINVVGDEKYGRAGIFPQISCWADYQRSRIKLWFDKLRSNSANCLSRYSPLNSSQNMLTIFPILERFLRT